MFECLNQFFETCIKIIKSILGDFTIIHKIKMDKKQTRLVIGIKVGKFSAGIDIRVRKKMSIIKFMLNGEKYKLVMLNNSFTKAVKTTCLFMNGIIKKDKKVFTKMKALSLSKSEYKKLKKEKEEMLAKLKKQKQHSRGPLIIKLGTDDKIPVF